MSAIDRLRVLARPSRLMAATVLGLSVAGIALAADTSSPEDRVRALLKTRLPKTAISAIDCGKIGGLCEITAGDNLFYVDAGARYLMIGRVYDMQTRQDSTAARLLEMNPDMLVGSAARANAAAATGEDDAPQQLAAASARREQQAAPAKARKLSLAGLPQDGAIVWGNPAGQTVTVFTDFRCGYCRALTGVLKEMNLRVVERPISVDEVLDGIASGAITEVLACGTAAVVTPITGFNSPARGPQVVGDGVPGPKTQEIRRHLVDIQFGRAEDPFGWTRRVC